MRSTRVLVTRLAIDDADVAIRYGELFVVVREGETSPGPNDWELSVQGSAVHRLGRGRHHLYIEGADGSVLRGVAVVRFTDGSRHLLRGDGDLAGWEDQPV